MPEEYFDQQPTADVVPIKQEGIIDNTALNINRNIETLNNVKLYGDETIDELKYIEKNGVHPPPKSIERFSKKELVSIVKELLGV